MHDGDDGHFTCRSIHFVNDNVWQSDNGPLVGAQSVAKMTHVRPNSEAFGGSSDTRNDFGRRAWIPLFDVPVNILKISLRF